MHHSSSGEGGVSGGDAEQSVLEAFVFQSGTPCVQVLYRSGALMNGVEIRLW